MPRIRTIKPELFQDEKITQLPIVDRFVFIGLISMADDAGRLLDNVKVIDAFVFPTTDDSARDSLARLSRMSRIRRGTTASGQAVIQIVGWERHQRVDHPNMAAALPPIETETPPPQGDASVRENGASGSREPRDNGATDSRLISTTNDLRSTTNDLRPTTELLLPRRRKKAATAPEPRESWLVPVSVAWEHINGAGSFQWGEAGHWLKPLNRAGLAGDEIAIRLGNYLACKHGEKFFNLKDFAEHHKLYSGPLVDEFGVPTDLGRRVAAGDVRRMSA